MLDVDVAARGLDAGVPFGLLHLDVARRRLDLDGAELAARLDVRGFRVDFEIGAVRAGHAEADVRSAPERDPEAVPQTHLDDHLVAFPAPDQVDPCWVA